MKPTRVLLVDDHEVVRKGLRALIDSRPEFEIVGEAVNGRDAIEKTKRLRPDVVILDLSMPEMSGLEATRQIVKNVPQTQVLVLTIHDSENMASAALQAGARGYVLKSDAGRELLTALTSLRDNKTYFTQKVAGMITKGLTRVEQSRETET
jgi:DNA-binding NarL/FixJ family response regulator